MRTLVAFLALLVAGDVAAEETPLPRGDVVAEVATLGDPEQQYALFLPADYDPARRWPALVVLDPRGRATMALELFLEAAREHGWIVLSSHQSRSDAPAEITGRAFEALLRELDTRFSVDGRRFYVAGMSGTAFLAWSYGHTLDGRLAGLVGVGAGLPREYDAIDGDPPFAYYGIAGWQDFNYQRQVLTDALLDATATPHRLAIFDGPHGWCPAPYARAAIDWLELIAMKEGRTPRREAFIDAQLAAARARAAEDVDPLTALRRRRELVRDFTGLRDVSADAARADELARSPAAAAAREQAERLAREERRYRGRHAEWFQAAWRQGRPPSVARARVELQLDALAELVASSVDPILAHSARRRLEGAYTQLAFYLPQHLEEQGEPEWAIRMLEIAVAMKPERPWAWLRLAGAYARAGRVKKALAALETLAGHEGFELDVERLETDEVWAPLRGSKSWRALLARLEAQSASKAGA